MGRTCLLVFVLVLCHLSVHSLSEEEDWKSREDCQPFDCGKLGQIKFPFVNAKNGSSRCGFLEVDGCDSDHQTIQLQNGSKKWYPISGISQGVNVKIRDEDFANRLLSNSCQTFSNLTFPVSPLVSFYINPNLTFLRCHPSVNVSLEPVPTNCNNFSIYYVPPESEQLKPPPNCDLIQLPEVPSTKDHPYSSLKGQNISDLLTAEHLVDVVVSNECKRCHYRRHGECLVNDKHEFYCSKQGKKNLGLPLGLGIGNGVLLMIIVVCSLWWRSHTKNNQQDQSIRAFLTKIGPLPITRYRHREIKKMTGSYRDKLGEGAFGTVFKGKLADGRLVAVKVLKESKRVGEDFINEVASISCTSHVNIVTLLGFCFDGTNQALVYEFMPNGSLEKYIRRSALRVNCLLTWEKLHEVAVGIAQGLEYLHLGCNTRILHFDIKPHNILLDENLCPKISDFGLAKICPERQSIISFSGTRGTAGYIAPEVFYRNFGGVSHKSDVYSYGMLVLEMAGIRSKEIEVSIEMDSCSDVYFPDWIYKRIEPGKGLGLPGIDSEEDGELARRLVIVSLWCIQTRPSDRPPMSRVIEMLRPSFQPLVIPPRPYLHSLPRSHHSQEVNSSSVSMVHCESEPELTSL